MEYAAEFVDAWMKKLAVLGGFLGCLWLLPVAGQSPTDHAEVLTAENSVDAVRPKAMWQAATVGQALFERDQLRTGGLSRASLRLTNLAVLRVNELTRIELLPPERSSTTPTLDLRAGAVFFFSRGKPQEIHLRTPLATCASRGTEFHAEVGAGGRTVVTMFEGAVECETRWGQSSSPRANKRPSNRVSRRERPR